MLCVVVAIDAVVLTGLQLIEAGRSRGDYQPQSLFRWALQTHPSWTAAVSLLVIAFIGCASACKLLLLRDGGGVVARSLGGTRVDRGTQDPQRRRLLNVVEEMSIASGVPMPEVYVMEQETAINAFAAGHSPANAAVAVTQGALRRLNREQLQGVIAHEFSHVLNGDMRLSIRLMGLVFGLLAIAMAGRLLLRLAAHSEKGAIPVFVAGGAIFVVGYVGLACARIIQALISRSRESLADASAVQFTRNPEGLKAALLRAAAQGKATGFSATDAEEVGHMLFLAVGFRLVSTHPTVFERLRALMPRYSQGQFDADVAEVRAQWQREAAAGPHADEPAAPEQAGGMPLPLMPPAIPALGAAVAASVGEPDTRHMSFARLLRRAIPTLMQQYAHTPETARILMCALLLSREDAVRTRQLQSIIGALGEGTAAQVQATLPLAQELEPMLRLPAVLRLFPVLRRLPRSDQVQLCALLDTLARSDARIDVFEFALTKLVGDALRETARPGPGHGKATLEGLSGDVGLCFAVLARHGARDDVAARRAYEAGLGPLLPRVRPGFDCPPDWAERFGGALDALTRLQPAAKELLIEGLVRTIAHDGALHVAEAELLRTVCAVLQCPLPPLLLPADPQPAPGAPAYG